MRIGIPTLGFGRGGGNRVLSRFATEWVRAGHHVTFLAHEAGEPPYFPTEAACLWLRDDGRVTTTPRHGQTGRLAGQRGVLRNVVALARGLTREMGGADVVLANHALTAWSVAAARVGARRMYYVQAYEPELYEGRGLGRRALASAAALSYRLPLERIVNADIYRSYGALRAEHVVPPGLDFGQFHPSHDGHAADGSAPGRPLVVGCIGRAEPLKGTREVVEAYRLLRRRGVPVRLRVAYGNVEPFLPIDDLEIVVPRNDHELADFYRSVDVLVAAGLTQHGAPHYPVLEAMACGVPVVTTGYMPADATNAWLVPPGDVGAIADAIVDVAADPAERARRVARALDAVRPLAWPALAARLLAVFGAK